nr:MAG TPA: hypothetical protein [Caudoviricetes sp.]
MLSRPKKSGKAGKSTDLTHRDILRYVVTSAENRRSRTN